MGRAIPSLIRTALLALLMATALGTSLGLIRPYRAVLEEVIGASLPPDRYWMNLVATPNSWTTVDGLVWRMDPHYRRKGPFVPGHDQIIGEIQFGFPFRSCAVVVAELSGAPTLILGSGLEVGDRALAMEIIVPGLLGNATILFMALLTVRGIISFVRSREARTRNNTLARTRWCTSDRFMAVALLSLFIAGSAGGAFALMLQMTELNRTLPWWFDQSGRRPNGFSLRRVGGNTLSWSWFQTPGALWYDVSGVVGPIIRANYLRLPTYDELSLELVAQFRYGVPFRSHTFVVSQRRDVHLVAALGATPAIPPAILADSAVTGGNSAIPMRWLLPGLLANTAIVFGLITAIPAARAFRRWLRRDCCIKCGYSRRGLDGSSKCPECGAAPSSMA